MDATKPPRKGGKRRQNYDDLFLKELPRTEKVIDSNSMINDLPQNTQQHIKTYIANRCPGSEEIVDALFYIANNYPKQLRTKELCETLESVTLIGAKINALMADHPEERKKNMTIYDLACGHGLLGILIAYRFPNVKVVCIDHEERPCWSTYIEAFEKYGEKWEGKDSVMTNFTFRKGDLMDTTTFQPQIGDYLICIHGCNDLSPYILQSAKQNKCGYAIMPCCVRENIFGVSTKSSNRNWGMDDDTRYATMVGCLAGKYDCEKIAAISKYITNRFLMIIGDYYEEGGGGSSDDKESEAAETSKRAKRT